jgi:hypothetical protein
MVAVGLSAAAAAIAPVFIDVRCPRLVQDLLSPPSAWTCRGSKVSSIPISCEGESGGDEFISLVWDRTRAIPLIAVSDEYGAVLSPDIVEKLASDLAGLAVVARIDRNSSWKVTRLKGKEWSCYGGAIRLFWPAIDDNDSPYQHPLWTRARLLGSMIDTEAAADRIRRELRRRILGPSAFAISEPPLFSSLRRAAREEELNALRDKATDGADYKALADEYFDAASRANETIALRDEEIADLREKIRGLQSALQSKRGGQEEVEPDTETPPSSVDDAVSVAMAELADDLVFGSAVNEGVAALARDAGPPDKILRYLRELGEFTRARRKGTLHSSAIKWLQQRGVTASIESETVRKSGGRKWDDGTGKSMSFDLHLKPSDATAPDRCVRIYFDFDETRGKTIVGWVGRHP